MPRAFYESTVGKADPDDDKFTVLSDIEVWVFPRGVATLADYSSLQTNVASIFQRETGSASGPSPEAGTTSGPNPFVTGDSGSIQFWAEVSDYDVILHDLVVPARIADRLVPWDATKHMRYPTSVFGVEENLRIIRGIVVWDGISAEVAEGSGFTVTRVSTGQYDVTFDTPFSDIPAVVAGGSSNYVNVQTQYAAQTNSVVRVQTRLPSTGALQDDSFSFIAIGPE